MFIGVLIYMYYEWNKKMQKKNNDIDNFMTKVEKELENDFEVPENKIFYIHKTPRNIKFIKKHDKLKHILYELKFLQIYDRALYNKIITYIEYFLKIHYKVMLKKYEFNLYYPILMDTRFEIMNALKTIYFNIPNISTILYIKDLDEYVEYRIKMIQSITYKLLKILAHAYKKPYKPPYDYDRMKDNHYALF